MYLLCWFQNKNNNCRNTFLFNLWEITTKTITDRFFNQESAPFKKKCPWLYFLEEVTTLGDWEISGSLKQSQGFNFFLVKEFLKNQRCSCLQIPIDVHNSTFIPKEATFYWDKFAISAQATHLMTPLSILKWNTFNTFKRPGCSFGHRECTYWEIGHQNSILP